MNDTNSKTKAFNMLNKLFDVSYEPFEVDMNGVVDVNKNQFKTIFLALTHAPQNSVIKVNAGVYQERLELKQSNIKLQANEPTSNVILMTNQYPLLTVHLEDCEQKVFLQSLKLVHLTEQPNHFIKNHTLKQFREGLYRGFKVATNMNTIIYVRKGIIQLDQCKISLANHKKRQLVPCIVVEESGTLIMNRCEVRGGIGTIGIVCKGGKVIIKESKIRDHGGIGVYCMGKGNSRVSIKNSILENCNEGIVLNGPFCGVIENNVISGCCDYGINMMGGNESRVRNNEVRNCRVGIEATNCFSLVMKNILLRNTETGISVGSKGGKFCFVVIKFNQIMENKSAGITVWGNNNESQVWHNQLSFNGGYGVKVCEGTSCPHIFKNKINSTLGYGIQLSRNSTSLVEKNDIINSLKTNLVVEGPNNLNNFIFDNCLKGARGEGLFLINCQHFFVVNNSIEKNNNGIVSVTSVSAIKQNVIKDNESNGVLLVDDNWISITNNSISQNKAAGIMVRDKSKASISQNKFTNNKYQLVIESTDQTMMNVESENEFQKEEYDIRIPSNYSCMLI